MQIEIKIPDKMAEHIKQPYDRSVQELLIVELYREGRFSVRQAAELLGVDLAGMFEVLARRKSYLNYGKEELNEDLSYARS
jgi:predicted HTH domain antitoxin